MQVILWISSVNLVQDIRTDIAAKYIGYVEKSNIKNPNTPAATTTKKYPFVGKVTASKLNVRKKPGTEHPLLPEYPMLLKTILLMSSELQKRY